MKRWMTRLARPGKCGDLPVAAGVPARGEAERELPQRSVSNPAKAILPKPTPQSLKKCRRLT